jgi:hypothetical protein
MRPLRAALFFAAGVLLAGCASKETPRDYTRTLARFYLENTSNDGTPVTLPRSAVSLMLNPKPVITEGDITNVELVQVELGKCLMFQLTPAGVRDFYRLSVAHQGRRLALQINGSVVGARRIDGAITNGVIYVFVELPDEALPALVENLKKTSAAVQREVNRQR